MDTSHELRNQISLSFWHTRDHCTIKNILYVLELKISLLIQTQLLLKWSYHKGLFTTSWFYLHNGNEYISTSLLAQTQINDSCLFGSTHWCVLVKGEIQQQDLHTWNKNRFRCLLNSPNVQFLVVKENCLCMPSEGNWLFIFSEVPERVSRA